MDLALLVLRLVVGLFFVGHGAQKLWGMFGGHGPAGTGQFFESIGITPGRRNAMAAGWSELIGGALLALGLLSPVGALLIVSVMTTAILSVHVKNGPWATNGGYEYNLVLIASAFVIAANPGDWSLDAAFGLGELHGTAMAVAALTFGAIGGYLAYVTGRGRLAPPSETPGIAGDPAVAGDQPVVAGANAEREGRITRDPQPEVVAVVVEEEIIVPPPPRRR
jgi:putative oxidoreductase